MVSARSTGQSRPALGWPLLLRALLCNGMAAAVCLALRLLGQEATSAGSSITTHFAPR